MLPRGRGGGRGGRGGAYRGSHQGPPGGNRHGQSVISQFRRMNVNGNDAPDGTPLYMPTPTPAPSTSTSTVGNKIDVRDQNKLAVSKLKHAFDEDFPFRTEFADAKSTVFSNHFVLSLNTDTPLYEYNIVGFPTKIGPTKAKLLVHKMMEKDVYLSSQRDLLATDYLTRIIAWTKLDGDQLKPFVVTEEDDRVPISLEVQYLGIVDTSILLNQVSANTAPDRHTVVEDTQFGKKENGELGPLINAFNIIISKAIGKDSMLLKSNKMFVTSGHKTLGPSQTSSLCTMRGYFYTIKAGMGHVLLNLNACTSAFFRPMLVSEFLSDNDTFINKMNRCDALYGLRVFINYERGGKLNDTQARIKTINGTGASVATQEFTLNSGQTVTVQKYLEDTYKLYIKFPSMPAINVGTSIKPTWIAPELLHILPYQLYKRPVPDHLTHYMLNEACKHPRDSRSLIENEGLKQLGITSSGGLAYFANCPVLQIDPRMVQIPSSRFQYPRIQYRQLLSLKDPAWNLRDQKFLVTNPRTQFKMYAIIDPRLQSNATQAKYLNDFRDFANNRYTTGQYQPVGLEMLKDPAALPQAMANAKSKGANFVLLILSQKSVAAYSMFKDLADCTYGFHSLCITEKPNLKGGNIGNTAGYFGNVMMKANLKAGGINHTVEGIEDIMKDTLVLGADVTHPGPGALLGTPSIAAIVGSVDKLGGKFLGSMRLQPKDSVEIIQDVEGMVIERLNDWRSKNAATWPKNVLYYRDGVSDGQYSQVKALELPQILTAFAKVVAKAGLKATPKFKLTALIVAKRHHLRFYPLEKEAAPKNGNCQAGTLVDSMVTNPIYSDFYLQSHNGLKGTAKPAHYFVLVNEMGLKEKVLQGFTHKLCYTYVRATLGVSYAPPAYYADRLCERGRCYLRSFLTADTNLRNELDNLKFKLTREKKADRDTKYRGTRQADASGKMKKTKQEVEQEDKDKKDVEQLLKKDTLAKARKALYGGEGDVPRNPWSESVGKTMFWM